MDNTFNWLFYIHYYKDFKKCGINNQNSALIHWNSIGKYDGRIGNPYDLFDWKFYVNYYQDIKDNNINTEELALLHWNMNGKVEKRMCNSYCIFDWEFYIDYYDDVKKLNINTEQLVYEHWNKTGSIENRITNVYSIFDWEFYINYYSDLKNSDINDESSALNHWYLHGKYENRIYLKKDLFNWNFYISYYNDLKDLGINSKENALFHWENFGIYENRKHNDKCIQTFNWKIYIYNYKNLINEDINNEDDAIKHWESNDMKELMVYNIHNAYLHNSDMDEYINKYCSKRTYSFINSKKNHIDVDLNFYKQANSIELYSKNDLLEHFHNNGCYGLIYHPKQLLNIYEELDIIIFNELIHVKYNDQIFKIDKFVTDYVYNKTFTELNSLLISEKKSSLSTEESDLLLLVFIGDENVGYSLLNKIIKYYKIQKFNIAVCFNSYELYIIFKNKIKINFSNNIMYISNEFGNDIVPTLLMYNHIRREFKFEHVIKLQTKTNANIFNELTDFLLTRKLEKILKKKLLNSNCVGHPNYYMNLSNDGFNQLLINNYKESINLDKSFIIGTIFYCNSNIMDYVLEFVMNNNFKAFLFNNMYDDNSIFQNNSHVHFLERLFGVIKN